jgi:hypothetical protein
MVSSKELGKLKLEHLIIRGIFISPKLYCFLNNSEKLIKKAKGIMS